MHAASARHAQGLLAGGVLVVSLLAGCTTAGTGGAATPGETTELADCLRAAAASRHPDLERSHCLWDNARNKWGD